MLTFFLFLFNFYYFWIWKFIFDIKKVWNFNSHFVKRIITELLSSIVSNWYELLAFYLWIVVKWKKISHFSQQITHSNAWNWCKSKIQLSRVWNSIQSLKSILCQIFVLSNRSIFSLQTATKIRTLNKGLKFITKNAYISNRVDIVNLIPY